LGSPPADSLASLPAEIIYFHVIGSRDRCVSSEFLIDLHGRVVYTRTGDDYNSLPHKVITAVHAVHSCLDYDYIYKTDDDQNLVRPDFFPWLRDRVTSYGGYRCDVNTHISGYWEVHDELPRDVLLEATTYCAGRFYFMNRETAAGLLRYRDEFEKRFIEDHAVGYYAQKDAPRKILWMNDMVYSGFVDY
jgi:hypothetical protein